MYWSFSIHFLCLWKFRFDSFYHIIDIFLFYFQYLFTEWISVVSAKCAMESGSWAGNIFFFQLRMYSSIFLIVIVHRAGSYRFSCGNLQYLSIKLFVTTSMTMLYWRWRHLLMWRLRLNHFFNMNIIFKWNYIQRGNYYGSFCCYYKSSNMHHVLLNVCNVCLGCRYKICVQSSALSEPGGRFCSACLNLRSDLSLSLL